MSELMFHMLSCFDLKPGEEISRFQKKYHAFVQEMIAADLVASSDEIGERQSDTPMDTDDERDHQYFVVMNFRDRAQVDAAYDQIKQKLEPGNAAHDHVYSRTLNPVFICWQDLDGTN